MVASATAEINSMVEKVKESRSEHMVKISISTVDGVPSGAQACTLKTGDTPGVPRSNLVAVLAVEDKNINLGFNLL